METEDEEIGWENKEDEDEDDINEGEGYGGLLYIPIQLSCL